MQLSPLQESRGTMMKIVSRFPSWLMGMIPALQRSVRLKKTTWSVCPTQVALLGSPREWWSPMAAWSLIRASCTSLNCLSWRRRRWWWRSFHFFTFTDSLLWWAVVCSREASLLFCNDLRQRSSCKRCRIIRWDHHDFFPSGGSNIDVLAAAQLRTVGPNTEVFL